MRNSHLIQPFPQTIIEGFKAINQVHGIPTGIAIRRELNFAEEWQNLTSVPLRQAGRTFTISAFPQVNALWVKGLVKALAARAIAAGQGWFFW
jgi:hypothetical protein